MKSRSCFGHSLSILDSSLSLVVLSFLLNPSVILLLLARFMSGTWWSWLVLGAVSLANIYVHAGVYGVFVEIASGRTDIFTYRRFRQNADRYWGFTLLLYFTVIVLPFAFLFLFQHEVTISFLSSHLDLLWNFLIAAWIIKTKFIRPLSLPRRPLVFSLKELGILGLLLAGQIMLYNLGFFAPINKLDVGRTALLFSRYIHFLAFLFIVCLGLKKYPEIVKPDPRGKELILINPLGPAIMEGLVSMVFRDDPLFFTILKALTPKSYRLREYNRVFWRHRYYRDRGLVAVSCMTSNCYEAYKIAREFKRRGAKVVMGGPHVSFFPQEALEYCDSVVVGEAEGVWQKIVEDYEKGRMQPMYEGPAQEAHLRMVRQEIINSPDKVVRNCLELVRGCKFNCDFCAIPVFCQGQLRRTPIPEVMELLEKIKTRKRNITFYDNNIYADPDYAKELFKAIKPLGLKWGSQCSIDIAGNQETLSLAKDSGCSTLLIGYEIAPDSVEQGKGGKLAMAGRYLELSRKIKESGIAIKAHFIFGYDGDSWPGLFRLWKFCLRLFPDFTIVSLLTPFPGSGFYERMQRENRIVNLNWRSYTGHALVMRHPRLNSFALSLMYPLMMFLFLTTTSRLGLLMFFIILVLQKIVGIF